MLNEGQRATVSNIHLFPSRYLIYETMSSVVSFDTPLLIFFSSNRADLPHEKSFINSVSELFLQYCHGSEATVIVPLCLAFSHLYYANGPLCTSSLSSRFQPNRVVFHHTLPRANTKIAWRWTTLQVRTSSHM